MFDIPNINKNSDNKENINIKGIVESIDTKFYNISLLENVEKVCKEIFPRDFKSAQDSVYGYCGWIFPDGVVLDTNYSTRHFWYEKEVKEILGEDVEFLKLGLIRYNLSEGLLELPYTPITREQLNALDDIFKNHFSKCQFRFGGGGSFRFGDNYRGKSFFIDPNVYEDEYPFDLIYRRDGEEMMKLIKNYCQTGKLEENIRK